MKPSHLFILLLTQKCISSIDVVDDDDRENKDTPSDYLPSNGELFEGDIVMDDRMRHMVKLGRSEMGKRAYLTGPFHSTWEGGVVPYNFDESILPEIEVEVHKGIKEYNRYTCVRWVPKKPEDEDYVTFRSKKHSCSSTVGKKGGQQFISLAHGCRRIGTVVHEMMHVLDFVHEHTRPDRNKFVEVRFDHIKPKLTHNFQKYDFGRAATDDLPYNFNSVMHYSNGAFSRDGENTLVAKMDAELEFGQRKQFSCLDIKEINALYKCTVPSAATIEIYCKDELMNDMTAADVEEQKDQREQRAEEEKKLDEESYMIDLMDHHYY